MHNEKTEEPQAVIPQDITLDEWLAEAKTKLDRFATEWRAEAMNSPDLYPERMPLGEWDEQARCWEGG